MCYYGEIGSFCEVAETNNRRTYSIIRIVNGPKRMQQGILTNLVRGSSPAPLIHFIKVSLYFAQLRSPGNKHMWLTLISLRSMYDADSDKMPILFYRPHSSSRQISRDNPF